VADRGGHDNGLHVAQLDQLSDRQLVKKNYAPRS
jgi:hypothetical protein